MWGYLVLDKWQGSEGQQWIVGLLTQHIVGVKNSTKRRIDDGRIQLCTCYANEALYLKENFPKSSKLSFSGFSETYWSEWHPGGNPI